MVLTFWCSEAGRVGNTVQRNVAAFIFTLYRSIAVYASAYTHTPMPSQFVKAVAGADREPVVIHQDHSAIATRERTAQRLGQARLPHFPTEPRRTLPLRHREKIAMEAATTVITGILSGSHANEMTCQRDA